MSNTPEPIAEGYNNNQTYILGANTYSQLNEIVLATFTGKGIDTSVYIQVPAIQTDEHPQSIRLSYEEMGVLIALFNGRAESKEPMPEIQVKAEEFPF